jgi:hypothetical protein
MKTKIKPELLALGLVLLFVIIAAAPNFSISGFGVRNQVCSDSDRGEDFYTSGEVAIEYILKSNPKTNTYEDRCLTDYKVLEHFCYGNKLRKSEYECPIGCSNRACVHSICTDSDSGKDYYKKGIAVLEQKTDETREDYCLNDKTLREYFCASQDEIRAVEYVCPQECRNGICY